MFKASDLDDLVKEVNALMFFGLSSLSPDLPFTENYSQFFTELFINTEINEKREREVQLFLLRLFTLGKIFVKYLVSIKLVP